MKYLIELADLNKRVRAGDGIGTAQALIAIAERLERLVELGEARQSSEDFRDTVELYTPAK